MAIDLDDLDDEAKEELVKNAKNEERKERIEKQENYEFDDRVFEGLRDTTHSNYGSFHSQVARDESDTEHMRKNPTDYIKESRDKTKDGGSKMYSALQIAEDTVPRDISRRDDDMGPFYRARDQYARENDVSKDEAEEQIKEMISRGVSEEDDVEDQKDVVEYAIKGVAGQIRDKLDASDEVIGFTREELQEMDSISDDYFTGETESGSEYEIRGNKFYAAKDDLMDE
ncbi:MAG: hypothetical protein ACI9LV_000243 [Candidatus Nanohaloarchaea archaeon]|jgi:hypothetical protein